MASIGASWAAGEIDIAIEHQASAIVVRLVGQMSPRPRGRRRGQVLIGGPTGERHALALAMLGDLLRLQGWEVLDLGGDTPAQSFVHAASKMTDLVAVGVSVTSVESEAAAAATLTSLRAAIGSDVPVVLGGGAIRDDKHARDLGADHFAVGARGFIEFLDQLKKKSA
jgi:methanogenic corrinoid protein MtbC1